MRHALLVSFVVMSALKPAGRPVLQSAVRSPGAGVALGQGRTQPDIDAAGLQLRVGFERPRGGHTVITMPLETYVARVLAGEAARESRPAALEALAITIRTFALANFDRHRADGFDLCDQTHCQVLRTATPETERAARATVGRVLMRAGAPASVYYSASCGGRTEIPSDVWPGADDPPFLPSRDDDACGGSPAWTAELGEADLLRALRAAGFRGDGLRELRIASRNLSGRVARLGVEGLRPEEISGQDLRMAVGRTLGWQHIKSTAFDLERQGAIYRFAGRGSGHGVGLCVIGSANLAVQGRSATEILERYFPGLDIAAVNARAAPAVPTPARPDLAARPVAPRPADDVLVSLPDDDAGERDAIARLASRARDDIARRLSVPAPSRVTLRFHATAADYEQATAQAWFTSGALVNGEVHLLPLAVLRERDVLERTIRHELVHVMADQTLAKRPQWVREGAAIYFAGERPIPGEPQRPAFRLEPKASCPQDNELLRPISIGGLTSAYGRAAACFSKQIAVGKSWRDVK